MDVSAIRATGLPSPEAIRPATGGQAFGELVNRVLSSQTTAEASASRAIESVATGQADNLHSVSLAVAQADLSFRLVLELRNRLTEAYQEVMRTQV